MISDKGTSALQRHTAAPQLAGYLYQIQCALIQLFDLQEGEVLGIEVVDDLSIESEGEIKTLGQYKYHIPTKQVKLRDTSHEFWNTLGTWASAISDKSLNLPTVQNFILFTRAIPDPSSLVESLTSNENRDIDSLINRLLAIPKSKDKKLLKAFEYVHALNRSDLASLIGKVTIKAFQPNLQETIDQLHSKVRKVGFHDHSIEDATLNFCGWIWFKVISGLEEEGGVKISEEDFHNFQCQIRDNYINGKLYPRFANLDVSEIEILQQHERTYIDQLNIVGATEEIKLESIVNYFRAMTERSTWLEKGELLPNDLILFDQELYSKWKNHYEDMCDDLGEEITNYTENEKLKRAGMKHFRKIQDISISIRAEWFYSYLTKGSYHALADAQKVGWHPCFRQLLKVT
ncbi:hypothetical protein ccbrp13_61230 [Ktedonobacteria bacterium brp13]|nr:hypothetical protein ccbrp13_61230 [Ktedonobacteria bacterium brp13]